jgi:hypothetical protein
MHASYFGVRVLLVMLMTEFIAEWSAGVHASECNETVGDDAQLKVLAAA